MTGVNTPTIGNIDYVYDYQGQQIQQITSSDTTNYLWDEFTTYSNILYEYGDSNQQLASYTYIDDILLSQTKNTETHYLLTDRLNSTHALVDSTGVVTDSYSYSAFGELVDQSGITETDYLFTGQQYDNLTGLYNHRVRYFDPALGRFISQDTYPYDFENPVELNRYVYTANNPVNWTDPSGLSLGEYVSNLKQSARAFFTTGTIGVSAKIAYARVLYLIYKTIPFLTGATCIGVGLVSDADLGTACDVPLTELAESFGKGVKVLLRASSESNPLNAMADLIRQVAGVRPQSAEQITKNLSVGIVSFDGSAPRWIWGVSGGSGEITRTLENSIEAISSGDEVATAVARTFLRTPDHAETKVLQHILDEVLTSAKPDSSMQLTLFTELFTCSGCEDNINQFIQIVRGTLDIDISINIIHSFPYKGRG